MAEVDVLCVRGHAVPPGAANCPRCGTRIERPEPTRMEAPPPVPPVPPAPPGTAAPHRGAARAPGTGLIPALTVGLAVSSPRGERSITLDSGDVLFIGRDDGPLTDLCEDNVSGRHARIRVGDDDVMIEDIGSEGCGSTNGTYLNGARIPANQPTPLPDGAVVTCGLQPPLTIRVEVTRL